MAELAVTALAGSGLFGATTAAAAGDMAVGWGAAVTVGEGAAAGSFFGAGSGLLTAASAALTGLGMYDTYQAGQATASQARMQATWDGIAAKQEILDSQQRAQNIRTDYLKKQASAMVAFGASGVTVGSGSAIYSDIAAQGERAVTTVLRAGQESSLGYQAEEAQQDARATSSQSSSFAEMFGAGAKGLLSIAARG
jgi:hypothetical protein